MPIYQVEDQQTGRSFQLEGDSPPTEQELNDIFSQPQGRSTPSSAAAFLSPDQRAERISSLRQQMTEPAILERDTWTKVTTTGAAAVGDAIGAPLVVAGRIAEHLPLSVGWQGRLAGAVGRKITEQARAAEYAAKHTPGNKLAAEAGGVGGSVLGSMIPAMVPGIGPALSVFSAGAQSYESTRREATQNFLDAGVPQAEADRMAHNLALGSGAITAGVTGLFNKYGARFGMGRGAERGLGDAVTRNSSDFLADPVRNAIARAMWREVKGEGAEEGMDAGLQEAFVNWQHNPKWTLWQAMQNTGKATLIGGVAGGVAGGLPAGAGVFGEHRAAANRLREEQAEADAINTIEDYNAQKDTPFGAGVPRATAKDLENVLTRSPVLATPGSLPAGFTPEEEGVPPFQPNQRKIVALERLERLAEIRQRTEAAISSARQQAAQEQAGALGEAVQATATAKPVSNEAAVKAGEALAQMGLVVPKADAVLPDRTIRTIGYKVLLKRGVEPEMAAAFSNLWSQNAKPTTAEQARADINAQFDAAGLLDAGANTFSSEDNLRGAAIGSGITEAEIQDGILSRNVRAAEIQAHNRKIVAQLSGRTETTDAGFGSTGTSARILKPVADVEEITAPAPPAADILPPSPSSLKSRNRRKEAPDAPKKPKIRRAGSAIRRINKETELGGDDIISFIIEFGGMMSKTAAKAQGEDRWKLNSPEYEGAVKIATHHNKIYGGSSKPDVVAAAAFEAGLLQSPDVNELWEAIVAASKMRLGSFEADRKEYSRGATEAAEHERWVAAVDKGKYEVGTEDLAVHDVLEVDGVKLRVTEVDGGTGDVTLVNGAKFGTQVLRDGSTIFVERVERGEESTDFLPEEDLEPAKPTEGLIGPVFHGGGAPIETFSEGANRGQLGPAYFTDSKRVAWKYALGGGIDKSLSLADYRRLQQKLKPARMPSLTEAYLDIKNLFKPEDNERVSWKEIIEVLGPDKLLRTIEDWSRKTYEDFEFRASEAEMGLKEWFIAEWPALSDELTADAHVENDLESLKNSPSLVFLGSTQLLNEFLDAGKYDGVAFTDSEAGGTTFVPRSANQIKITNSKAYTKPAPQLKEEAALEPVTFEADMFQGRGATPEAVYGPEAVAQGRAVPILGPGNYYAFSRSDAEVFGKVSKVNVQLSNPLVIDSSRAWSDLLQAANAQHLDSGDRLFYTEPQGIAPATLRLKAHVQSLGHDGIIIRGTQLDQNKRLRESFGHDQVVSYAQIADAPDASPAKQPKLGAGENQGDLIASTQREDIALVGEKGTDAERLAAQKAQAAQDAAEAKANQDRNQMELGAKPKPSSIKDFLTDKDKNRLAELQKKLHEILGGTVTGGDPAILIVAGEMAVIYIKGGTKQFASFAKQIKADMPKIWDKLKVHLKSIWEAAAVDHADIDEPTRAEAAASIAAAEQPEDDQNPKQDEEERELELTLAAREIAAGQGTPIEKYMKLVGLYAKTPRFVVRTAESKANQAYSTPPPLAYLVGLMADIAGGRRVLEPTAGNGMLLIGADPTASIIANEIDPKRSARLRIAAPTATVKSEDATSTTFHTTAKLFQPDRIVANPPFGSVLDEAGKSKRFPIIGGFTTKSETTSIDIAIMLNTLETMAPDGKAVFIIGSKTGTPYADFGTDEARAEGYNRKEFLELFKRFNVVDFFTVAGPLYNTMGAGWPVDVIVVDGKGAAKYAGNGGVMRPWMKPPPVFSSWEKLGIKVEQHYGTDKTRGTGTAEPGVRDGGAVPPQSKDGRRPGASAPAGGRPERRDTVGGGAAARPGGHSETGGDSQSGSGVAGEPASGAKPQGKAGPISEATEPSEAGLGGAVSGEDLQFAGTGIVEGKLNHPYVAVSQNGDAKLVAPSNLADQMRLALLQLEQETGQKVDDFVAGKLGWTREKLFASLSAPQIDAVALAIRNVDRGSALINGDQTGVGKGRTLAALIEYARKIGKIPVFITAKKTLYEDMAGRDLPAVGNTTLKPFITDSKYSYVDGKGNEVSGSGSKREELEEIARTGKLPAGHDAFFTTYEQLKSDKPAGYKEAGKDKARRKRKRISKPDGPRFAALRAIAPNAIFILDEAHVAAGQGSDLNMKLQEEILPIVSGAYMATATFSKRPDNLGLYSVRTLISRSGIATDALVKLLQRGGNALQQGLSSMLTRSGEFVRREQNFEGVNITFKAATLNPEAEAEAADTYTSFLRDLKRLSGQVNAAAEGMADSENQVRPKESRVDIVPMSFGSRIFNLSQQYLLALRTDSVVREALAILREPQRDAAGAVVLDKNGKPVMRKPFISLYNTMSGPIVDLKQRGLPFSFNGILMREMQTMLEVTIKDPMAKADPKKGTQDGRRKVLLKPEDLPDGGAFYRRLESQINATDLSSFPISPIDHIKAALRAQGIKVAEITGRDEELSEEGGDLQLSKREQGERNEILRGYNNGETDAIIVNGASSTGVSAHTDPGFKDQRQRVMIIAQPQPDIAAMMQMLGRIMRFGQTRLPEYIFLRSSLAAEKRFLTMLRGKLSSLNANTSADTESDVTQQKDFAEDIFNEVGDEVVYRVLQAHPIEVDLAEIAGPKEKNDGTVDITGFARKATGAFPLLPDSDAKMLWEEIDDAYRNEIRLLDEVGENPLKATPEDLRAVTLESKDYMAGYGTTPFDGPATLERVRVKPGKSPLTHSEAVAQAAGNEARVRREVSDWIQNSRVAERERVSTSEARGSTPDQIDRIRQNFQEARQKVGQALARMGQTFGIDSTGSGDPHFYGVVSDIRLRGKETSDFSSASKQEIVLATNTTRRTLTLAISKTEGGEKYLVENLPGTEDAVFNDTAEKSTERYLVTGNLLRGYEKGINAQTGRTKPRVVMFTRANGNVETGILMPPDFNPNEEASPNQKPITTAAQFAAALKSNTPISAGDVRIVKGVLVVPAGRNWKNIWGSPRFREFVGYAQQHGGSFAGEVDLGRAESLYRWLSSDLALPMLEIGSATDTRESRADGTGLPSADVEAHLASAHGIKPGGLVSVVNEPNSAADARAVFDSDTGQLLRIEINAAKISSLEAVDRALQHEFAHVVWRDGGVDGVVAQLTADERAGIEDDVTRLGYSAEVRPEEVGVRGLDALANAWRGRGWFKQAVGKVLAWAADRGLPMTRLAAERIAARAIAKVKAEVLKMDQIEQLAKLPGAVRFQGGVLVPPGQREAAESITAKHGTPYKVDRFTTDKIGTGEGAQVYGHGLYFAENEMVAEEYRKKLSGGVVVDGKPYIHDGTSDGDALEAIVREVRKGYHGKFAIKEAKNKLILRQHYLEQELAELVKNEDFRYSERDWLKGLVSRAKASVGRLIFINPDRIKILTGYIYTVSLNVKPDELLDWDKPLNEQSAKVMAMLTDWISRPKGNRHGKQYAANPKDYEGGSLYQMLIDEVGSDYYKDPKQASEHLASFGIKGIRYLDKGSRGAKKVVRQNQINPNEWLVLDANDYSQILSRHSSLAEAEAAARSAQTYNYVVFNENDITITHENGQPVTAQEAARSQGNETTVESRVAPPKPVEQAVDEERQGVSLAAINMPEVQEAIAAPDSMLRKLAVDFQELADRPLRDILADPDLSDEHKQRVAIAAAVAMRNYDQRHSLVAAKLAHAEPKADRQRAELLTNEAGGKETVPAWELVFHDAEEAMGRTDLFDWFRTNQSPLRNFTEALVQNVRDGDSQAIALLARMRAFKAGESPSTTPDMSDSRRWRVSASLMDEILQALSQSGTLNNALAAAVDLHNGTVPESRLLKIAKAATGKPSADTETQAVLALLKKLPSKAQMNSAARADSIARQLRSVRSDVETLRQAAALFDRVAATPEVRDLRVTGDESSGFTVDMAVDAVDRRTFKPFRVEDLNQPEVEVNAVNPNAENFAEKAIPQIKEWFENAQVYVASYEAAQAAYENGTSDAAPHDLGMDRAVYNGLKIALVKDAPLSLSPGARMLETQIGPRVDPLRFGNLSDVTPFLVQEQVMKDLWGLFGNGARQGFASLRGLYLDIQKIADQPTLTHLSMLKSKALKSHPTMGENVELYRHDVLNPALHEGRVFESELKVGHLLPTGETVTQADMDLIRASRKLQLAVQKAAQSRADEATRQTIAGVEYSRPAASTGTFGTPRHANESARDFIQNLTDAYKLGNGFAPDDDLTANTKNPVVKFWNLMGQTYGALNSHVMDSIRDDRAIHTDSRLLRAQKSLARQLRDEGFTRRFTTVGELVDALVPHFPEDTGLDPHDTVVRELSKEFRDYARLAEAGVRVPELIAPGSLWQTRVPDTTKSDRQTNLTLASVKNSNNEFTRSAGRLEMPSVFYDYGVLTLADLLGMKVRALADANLKWLVSVEQVIGDLEARIERADPKLGQPDPKALPDGVEIHAARNVLAAAKKMVAIEMLPLPPRSGYGATASAGLSNVVKTLLIAPVVAIRNVSIAPFSEFLQLQGTMEQGRLMALALTVKHSVKGAIYLALRVAHGIPAQAASIPSVAAKIKYLAQRHPKLYAALHRHTEGLYQQYLGASIDGIHDLGFGHQHDLWGAMTQHWREVGEYADSREAREFQAPILGKLRKAGRYLRAGVRSSNEFIAAVNLQVSDDIINIQMLEGYHLAERQLRKIGQNYGRRIAKLGKPFDPTDKAFNVSAADMPKARFDANRVLGLLREQVERAGMSFEHVLNDYAQRGGGKTDAEFFTPEQAKAMKRLIVSDRNAATPFNRPAIFRKSPIYAGIFALQGFAINLGQEQLAALRSTRGAKNKRKLLDATIAVAGMLTAGMVFGLLGDNAREFYRRFIARLFWPDEPVGKEPSMFDPEFWKKEGMVSRLALATASSISGLGQIVLPAMQQVINGKGYGIVGASVPLAFMTAVGQLIQGVYALREYPEDWGVPLNNFLSRFNPIYRGLGLDSENRKWSAGTGTLNAAIRQAGLDTEKAGGSFTGFFWGRTTAMKHKLVGSLMEAQLALKKGDTAGYDKAMTEAARQGQRLIQDAINHGSTEKAAAQKAGLTFSAMNPARRANGGASLTQEHYEQAKGMLSGRRLQQWEDTEAAYQLGAGLFPNAKGGARNVASFKQPERTGGGGPSLLGSIPADYAPAGSAIGAGAGAISTTPARTDGGRRPGGRTSSKRSRIRRPRSVGLRFRRTRSRVRRPRARRAGRRRVKARR